MLPSKEIDVIKYAIGIVVVLLLTCGCTKRAQEEGGVQESGDAAAASSSALVSLAGTMLDIGGGQQVEVLSVGKFDEQQKSLAGLVAIEGRVAESYPDRGALIMVDTTNMEGCAEDCCPKAQVPIKLPGEDFEGEFPVIGQQVIVIGTLTQLELGYELAIMDIRANGDILLKPMV